MSVFIFVEQEVPHKLYRYCIETIFFCLLVLTVKRHKRGIGMGQEGPGGMHVGLKL
jgi:hypothetical protein